MARKSARLIGAKIGKSARDVNIMLEQMGFIKKSSCVSLTGTPIWEITDLGSLHGEKSKNPKSNGHIWDEDVAEILKKTFKL